jgi:putative transposase
MARSRKRHIQLDLERARKPTGQGGWRPGAGRKCKPGAVSHDPRPAFPGRFPQHVTLRLGADAPSIAREWLLDKVIRPAIAASKKDSFAVIEFNVLSNHVHLIVEATDAQALARGVQGLAIRIARRVNRALHRDGKLFGQRYHARSLRTPREVRNALRYVLLNRKHHAAEQKFFKGWIDPFSSAIWFRGWQVPVRMNAGFNRQLAAVEPPVALPETWLLRVGWRKAGALSYDDRPAVTKA